MRRVRVYRPLDWQAEIGYRVSGNFCRAAVHQDHGVGFRQCGNRPKEEVDGVPLCRLHAKMAHADGGVDGD